MRWQDLCPSPLGWNLSFDARASAGKIGHFNGFLCIAGRGRCSALSCTSRLAQGAGGSSRKTINRSAQALLSSNNASMNTTPPALPFIFSVLIL